MPAILACVLYLIGAGLQWAVLHRDLPSKRTLVIAVGLLAICAHGYFAWHQIFTGKGIDIGALPLASVIALAIAGTIILSSLRRPVENLVIVLFPLAAIIIVLAIILPGRMTPRTDIPRGIVTHIVLAVVAYSMLTIAAFQAMLLSFGDYKLKHRSLSVLRNLPPLQTMEGLLFELLWLGLIFMSLSIVTGFLFLEWDYKNPAVPALMQHAAMTLAAWIVFAVLLWGRYRLGWRGAVASRWTLTGFALLAIGYFGSKFVLGMMTGHA
ncbi:MAG TPA: cytochrome c biogenesis protein CcsA [Pseudomonadales bacterium]|nr:cytochrome c biogenesis protein CcsA [Pseudomonadales bacterium]